LQQQRYQGGTKTSAESLPLGIDRGWDVQPLVAQIGDSVGLAFGRQPLDSAHETLGTETVAEFSLGE
jgi:hypothetical protein